MARRIPKILTPAEVDSLLAAARDFVNAATTQKKQIAAWRDFVMIQTGLLAGPRVAELCDLHVIHAELNSSPILSIRGGKGDKDRNVPIGKRLQMILKEWIGCRTDGFLFPGPKGKHLSPRTFQLRLEALAKKAGIKKKVHPHLLRHTYANTLLRSGADVREVMELLGHSNLGTTQIYLSVDQERLRAAVDRL